MSEKITVNHKTDALIIVDVQNDFCPGGALAVQGGDEIVPVINDIQQHFEVLVFSRDWHPADHTSFSDQPQFVDQSWPVHCVANTDGAAFHPDLHVPEGSLIISKASEREQEAYSAFQDTGLSQQLKNMGIQLIYVCGLATDYCVKSTVLDAQKQKFTVFCIQDACRGVDVPPGTALKAMEEMKKQGVAFIESSSIG